MDKLHLYYDLRQAPTLNDLHYQALALEHQKGCFTTLAIGDQGEPLFLLEAHYQRLANTCSRFAWTLPWSRFSDFEAALHTLILRENLSRCILRINIVPELTPGLIFSVRAFKPNPHQPARLKTVVYQRDFHTDKLLNRFAEANSLAQASQAGFNDFLRLTEQGLIAESAYANVFFVLKTGQIVTPDCQRSNCLPGLMRHSVLALALEQGLSIIETELVFKDLEPQIAACFLTNAVYGIQTVSQIDTLYLDPEPDLLRPLQAVFTFRYHNTH
jgi:branched-subunit amino acid aminotransferase/4-amino-4-deoxychorismate lyase